MKPGYFFSLFLLLIVSASQLSAAAFQRDKESLVIPLQQGVLKLEFPAQNIIHIVHSRTDSFAAAPSLMLTSFDKESVDWRVSRIGKTISVDTDDLEARIDLLTGNVDFYDHNGAVLLREDGREMMPATVAGEDVFHARQNFDFSDDEGIYGLGQFQDGLMNYRGHDLTLVQTNTIAVTPVLVSSKNWGILWDNYSMTTFHDGEDGAFLWSEVADAIDYYFIAGANLDEVVAGYRLLTGAAPMFGKWAYGYWQSKERYRKQDEIIGIVREYRKRRIPLDNIVQDWTYWGDLGWNAMDFDRKNFPDPPAMLKSIHDLNAHYMISIWPNFDAKTAVFKEMQERGFLFSRDDGAQKGLYDAFNFKARDLYWQWLNKNLFSIGVDGWWMDATEPEFGDTQEQSAANAKYVSNTALGSWARYLNAFSLMSTKGVYESQRKATDEKRVYILTRSVYAGQQRYGAVTWSGDITATWQVLRNQISAGINLCMTGIPYWTTDIGAFIPNTALGAKDEAYREIYTRWFQFGAFCPMFRSHGTGTPREVWRFGDEGDWAYDALVKFDNLRYRLLPYIYSLAWKVTHENYTIMRSLEFDFNDDAKVKNIDNQYMFGPAFLVSPVTEKMYFEPTFVGDVIPTQNLVDAQHRKNGLSVEFYNGQNFDTLAVVKNEPVIDFDWNDGSRPAGVHQHYYSIRFTGEVLSNEAGEYTFTTTSNDGIRVWVDDQLIIDNWTDHGVTINMGAITLKANTRYKLKVEYYQTLGGAVTKLAWITPNVAKTVAAQKMPPTKTWPVYVPKSRGWFDFWTGESLAGGQQVEAPAPIDQMPLYVRAGSIVPMGPFVHYADEKPADPIELRIYRGADGRFTLYEDENDNYNYEKGVYATIPFFWNDAQQTLTIGDRSGRFPGMAQERTFRVVLVGENHGVGVNVSDAADKVIRYSGEQIIVKLK